MTNLEILNEEPLGTVSPRLYGHFAEHLARCCYDGMYLGDERDSVPKVGGFRVDVVSALKALPTPLLRWPGGCYADHYHWRDGIGPKRPARLGLSCGRRVLDDNGLGTHEFLALCEMIGAEPYLAGNMGSGSVQELCDWVEYCNCELPTSLGQERAKNGRGKPWAVKLWGVGNENWGCGGNYDPESYALEYRRYALMMSDVDPSIETVFCGHNSEWNRRALEKMRDHYRFIDHYSIHCYWIKGGPGIGFTDEQYYNLFEEAESMAAFIQETRDLLEEVSGGRKRIGIALDEWGVWHPEARTWGPDALAAEIEEYEQPCTLRDALALAVGLEVLHKECASVSLANLAQVVNVLHAPIKTKGDRMWLTPTYHALRMHAPHLGGQVYRTVIEGGPQTPTGRSALSATATSGGVTITNRHLSEAATIRVNADMNLKSAFLLSSQNPSDENGPGNEEKVIAKPLVIGREAGSYLVDMPPHSLVSLVAG